MKVSISTLAYERSHGAGPRGRGSWGFCDAQFYDKANYLDFVWWAPADLTYGQAKKAAAVEYRNCASFSGVLVVCP